MNRLLMVLGVTVLALLLSTGVVFGLDDKTVLTSPPEAVAEQFLRKVATERWDVSTDQLSDELKKQVRNDELKRGLERLRERAGEIQNVSGQSARVNGDEAKAVVLVEGTKQKELKLHFGLKYDQGQWSIDDLGDFAPIEDAR